MKTPIIEFYEDDGLINQTTELETHECKRELFNIFKQKKIDTCLFLFVKDDDDCLDHSQLEEVYKFKNGSNVNMAYIYKNKFLIAKSPLGGPAAVGFMEELGFLGIKNFIAFGSAGQIDHNFDGTKFVLVDRAIRDEGTSYHYQKPSVYSETDKGLTGYLRKFLDKEKLKCDIRTTWTTDAFFRETSQAIDKRIKQGAVCVEMECASWCACAKFRGFKFAQLLYFSDTVKQEGHTWNLNRKEMKNQMTQKMIKFVDKFVKDKNKE